MTSKGPRSRDTATLDECIAWASTRTNAIRRGYASVQSPIKPIFDLFGVRRDRLLALEATVPKPVHHACQVWRFAFAYGAFRYRAFGYGVSRRDRDLIVAPNPPPSG